MGERKEKENQPSEKKTDRKLGVQRACKFAREKLFTALCTQQMNREQLNKHHHHIIKETP